MRMGLLNNITIENFEKFFGKEENFYSFQKSTYINNLFNENELLIIVIVDLIRAKRYDLVIYIIENYKINRGILKSKILFLTYMYYWSNEENENETIMKYLISRGFEFNESAASKEINDHNSFIAWDDDTLFIDIRSKYIIDARKQKMIQLNSKAKVIHEK